MRDFNYGVAYTATATGAVCISSANSRVFGILFTGTGTGSVRLFHGVTATSNPLGGNIIAYATVTGNTANAAIYFPFPAYASGGLTMNVGASSDPKLTLFWSPE